MVPYVALIGGAMSLPSFDQSQKLPASVLWAHIADRVRLERRRVELSQKAFAAQCGIPLRTYKRFELGQCDSLQVFLQIVIVFERVTAVELLFPPQSPSAQSRLATAVLDRVIKRRLGIVKG